MKVSLCVRHRVTATSVRVTSTAAFCTTVLLTADAKKVLGNAKMKAKDMELEPGHADDLHQEIYHALVRLRLLRPRYAKVVHGVRA